MVSEKAPRLRNGKCSALIRVDRCHYLEVFSFQHKIARLWCEALVVAPEDVEGQPDREPRLPGRLAMENVELRKHRS